LLAIEGMRKCGFDTDADRISYNFVSMVAENFRHDGTIREEYNAVFLVFLHDLPQAMAEKLAEEKIHPE
jgi:hypothetical protein